MAAAAPPSKRAIFHTVHFALCAVRHPVTAKWLCVDEKKDRGWWIAGGGVDYGETFADGAIREVFEETSINVRLTGVLRVEHDTFGRDARMRVIFLGEPVDPDQAPKSVPDSESNGAAWLTVDEMLALEREHKLRGREPLSWAQYVEAGGVVSPLTVLAPESDDAPAVAGPAPSSA